jgi:hypothetical protein
MSFATTVYIYFRSTYGNRTDIEIEMLTVIVQYKILYDPETILLRQIQKL